MNTVYEDNEEGKLFLRKLRNNSVGSKLYKDQYIKFGKIKE
jgi:hypothetical protein